MEIMLEEVVLALNQNGFNASLAHTVDEALDLTIDIIERESPETVAIGSSATLKTAGIYNLLKNSPSIHCIDTTEIISGLVENPDDEALHKQIKLAMHSDMFFCSSNAIIANGQLVNVDMVSNRVAMLGFGPEKVVLVAGQNKVVSDLPSAVGRIKNIAAPMNTKRLKMDTPCVETGKCMNCDSPQRMCVHWSIMEKCFPKHRICVILVEENLGF